MVVVTVVVRGGRAGSWGSMLAVEVVVVVEVAVGGGCSQSDRSGWPNQLGKPQTTPNWLLLGVLHNCNTSRGVGLKVKSSILDQLYKWEQSTNSKMFFYCKSKGQRMAQFIPLFRGSGRGSSPRLGLGKIEA